MDIFFGGTNMPAYQRLFDAIYEIDLDENEYRDIEIHQGQLDGYLQHLINSLFELPDNKLFSFRNENTQIKGDIASFLEEKTVKSFQMLAEDAAKRLLRCEVDTNDKIKKLGKQMRKGNLILSYIQLEEETAIIFTKVEHESYLSTKRFITEKGVPIEKGNLRTCIIKFNIDDDVTEIIITDSNSTLSTYWYNDFLELKELNSSEKNTKIAFKSIDMALKGSLLKKSPSDYTFLRNLTTGYFRSHPSFNFDEFVEESIAHYSPIEPEKVDIDKVTAKIRQLPEKKKFDTKFDVAPKVMSV